MPFKDKISSFLFRSKSKEGPDDVPLTERADAPQEVPEAPPAIPEDPALLELPADHPFRRLLDLRQEEGGQHLPPLRLCLDEDGTLPPELVAKEKVRLQAALKTVCASRWKLVKAHEQARRGRKKTEPEGEPLALDAQPWIFLSSDKLYAWMLVLPPVGPGAELSRDMVYRSLTNQGVSFGLDTALLDRLSHDRERYSGLFLAARGKPAFDGRSGNIVEHFPRRSERMLTADEFGQVDYTSLNLISNVEQGQEICRLIRPTEGEPGRTVLDQEIPAKSGAAVPLPKGRNTELSEDGEALVASIAGHVEFSGRCFQVKPVLDIDGDVDFSTGNIKFVGDVSIKGDVLSGFTVKAMGNIYVGGVVEAGSTVEAGGDLTVVKGIVSDGTTVIRASGCLFSKYIENTTVYVKQDLQTDCIVNGRIYCDGEVLVRSGRGSIMGGRVWAAKKVSASAIGARSEVRTSIALGGCPCASLERELLRQELKALDQELERLGEQPDNPAKASLMGKVRMKQSVAGHKLKQLEEDLAADLAEPKEKDSGRMECGIAYAGTEISFGDETLRLRHEHRKCSASLVKGEIVIT